jgi:hypothetical protein
MEKLWKTKLLFCLWKHFPHKSGMKFTPSDLMDQLHYLTLCFIWLFRTYRHY